MGEPIVKNRLSFPIKISEEQFNVSNDIIGLGQGGRNYRAHKCRRLPSSYACSDPKTYSEHPCPNLYEQP